MNTRRNRERGWILLGAFLAVATAYIWVDETHVPDLAGHWVSKDCETLANPNGGESRLTRDYAIDDETWHLDLTFFEDQDCARKSFALGMDGHYELGGKSHHATGATLGRFMMERLELTAHTPEMSALFSQGRCGNGPWTTGAGQDISRSGCLQGIPSVSSCPVEYDVVKRKGDVLRFGERSGSLCVPGVYPPTLGAALQLKQE